MKNDTLMQYFEWYLPNDGTFWNLTSKRAKSLSAQGITGVWLPPAYKGSSGKDDVGYGVYDMYDLGEFDQKGTVRTKYGTRDEYLKACKDLQKNNVGVIVDVVFNHRMGADGKETVVSIQDSTNDREEAISSETTMDVWTKYTFPGRKGKYSTFTWDSSCFDGTDWDDSDHRSGVFLFKGHSWDNEVDTEDVNYDYLMGDDLDMSNPTVIEECKNWGKWYVDTVKPQGIRLDALKHIRFSFFHDWIEAMNKESGTTLFGVGEYWNADVNHLLHYLDVCQRCICLFDVPLHYKFTEASYSNGEFDMRTILDNTLVQKDEFHAVTFVDNHDTQPGQALQSFVNGWFKPLAYALILLRCEGVPCVFYGDYYGIPHDSIPPVKGLKELIKLRECYAYGKQDDYFDHPQIIGWTREGDEEHSSSALAVLLTDGPGGTKTMYVGSVYAGKTFVDALGNQGNEVLITEDGNGAFSVDGGSVSAWILKEEKVNFDKAIAKIK